MTKNVKLLINNELRDRLALALATEACKFADSPLTTKGKRALRKEGFAFFSKQEARALKRMADKAMKMLLQA
jgi:hypothetical protein